MSRLGVLWAAIAGTATIVSSAEPAAAVNFHAKVQPILEKYCYDCHDSETKKGELDLQSLESRDFVTLGLYGLALTLHVYHWAQWQDRAKPKAEVVPTTTYGRPLARKA